MGAIPAASLFTFAEKVVDYCNHSNILILCFVSYIIHYVALANITDAGILLVFEILEIFTLHLMWITAILYLRHLVPRKFTACGQALPVIAHFCLGQWLLVLLYSIQIVFIFKAVVLERWLEGLHTRSILTTWNIQTTTVRCMQDLQSLRLLLLHCILWRTISIWNPIVEHTHNFLPIQHRL